LKLRTALVFGVLAALLFVSMAVYFTSSLSILGNPDDFGPTNAAWNGLSTFVSVEKPTILQNLSSLPPDGTGFVLLEDGPSTSYTPAEVRGVSSFISSGGTLILADDYGVGNSLLSGMRLYSRFTGSLLTDPLFNFRNSFLVVAPDVTMKNVSSLALNYATTLTVSDPGSQVLGYSSDFSYLYLTQPGGSIASAHHGPFPVLAEIPDVKGRVFLIADDSVFINSMMFRNGNAALLKDLSTGKMLLDTSHLSVGPATLARNFELSVYSALSIPELRYSLVVAGLAGILAYRFSVRAPVEEEELKTVLQEHPEWSEEKLRKLKEEMGER